ncbi:MAG: hypothetical protein ACK4Z8_05020 [Novosphingobium sp.]
MDEREKPRYVSTSYGVNPPFGPTTSGGDISAAALDAPSGDVERVALAIYNAPDSQSGDHVGTVIYNSEHLFVEVRDGETEADATKRTAMDVCRDAARAALSAMPRQAGINEGLEMAAKERAAIVAWLRDLGNSLPSSPGLAIAKTASAIEIGEHLKD